MKSSEGKRRMAKKTIGRPPKQAPVNPVGRPAKKDIVAKTPEPKIQTWLIKTFKDLTKVPMQHQQKMFHYLMYHTGVALTRGMTLESICYSEQNKCEAVYVHPVTVDPLA